MHNVSFRRFGCSVRSFAVISTSLYTSLMTYQPAFADGGKCKSYEDSRGEHVVLHPRSFADKVICPGSPSCSEKPFSIKTLNNRPENALGPPSYLRGRRGRRKSRGIYSLGCRRSATWEFVDNLIVDVPGPDIFVFEVGKAREATTVELSTDGDNWLHVGEIGGGKGSVEISDYIKQNLQFRFIRLTDLGSSCGNRTAGADIDAIAAYGYSWAHVEDDTSVVFFNSAKWELKEGAKVALDRLFSEFGGLPNHWLLVSGHTDSIGSVDSNLTLSRNRAAAVREYLIARGHAAAGNVEIRGLGESVPVNSNETPVGRKRNRRVEIAFVPLSPCRQ